MKKIYIFIAVFLLLFSYSCRNKINNNNNNKNDNNQESDLKITLNYSDELKDFITYDQNYEIKKDEEFVFPQIESKIYIVDNTVLEEDTVIYTRSIYDFTFYGWKTTDNILIENNSVKVEESTTFTPIYNLSSSSYVINFYTNGFLLNKSESQDLENFELPVIENQNYTFEGWYYNDSYLGKKVESIKYSQINDEIILYAKLVPTVEYVNFLVENVPIDVTIFDIDNIEHAYNSYQKLSYQNKQLIESYNKLKTAYQNIEKLKTAYAFYCKLEEVYNKDISPILKYDLENLMISLESLDQTIIDYIPNLDYVRLNTIIDEVNALYEQYYKEAQEFDKKIAKLPIFVEQFYEEEIINLYNEYQNLDKNIKDLLNSKEKIQLLYDNLQNLKNKSHIFYLNTYNTNNIYTSKQQLFEAFFTDFYYYIAAYHGLNHLKDNNLYNVDDFVKLAGDFTGAGANNLYGIGNIAGRYMLEKDVNGILENQTENGFFGFCYQNNLYKDLLPFFINFFAFWRIDEKYASSSNYGADIFAESWAPTVDIAKFFYYDENTSYVKTDRMIDCLTNVASVVYNFSELSLNTTTIKLRGYIFEGWYDNENYEGEKITLLSNTTPKKLYAKWTIDQNQVDLDNSNLVDIYIYNLTTAKAIVNNETVGYVKKMYDNLSEKGKKLVNNYDTLQQLLTKYN
ncbi:MAG: hypothetical protein E7183_04520 [Erysipelotrichaceae bacterium]|nr:hypothetical protein [Erysipelotrichaceae bacterium]